jgi:hypothetical protein
MSSVLADPDQTCGTGVSGDLRHYEAQIPFSCTLGRNLASPNESVAAVSDAVFLSGGPEGTFVVD